jgi:hypothetical protein
MPYLMNAAGATWYEADQPGPAHGLPIGDEAEALAGRAAVLYEQMNFMDYERAWQQATGEFRRKHRPPRSESYEAFCARTGALVRYDEPVFAAAVHAVFGL